MSSSGDSFSTRSIANGSDPATRSRGASDLRAVRRLTHGGPSGSRASRTRGARREAARERHLCRGSADERVLVHTLTGLYDEVERRGVTFTAMCCVTRSPPPTHRYAALEVPVGAPVVVLERLRFVDGEPWSLSTTWMPEAIGAVTLGADLTEASLYQLLASHGIVATQGTRSAEATVATAEQARRLGLGDGVALLRLRSVGRDAHGVPVEHFVAYHRGDRSRFEFQLGDPTSRAILVRSAEADA